MIDLIYFAQAAEAVSKTTHESTTGVVGLLGLNWKLFIAQLVNFTIIVLIFWKWVFNPVTRALSDRTKKIETSLKDAEKIKHQVTQLEKYKVEQEAQARAEHNRILARAEVGAKEQSAAILNDAKLRADKMLVEAEKKMEAQKAQLFDDVKEQVATLVVEAAEKILTEKLDSSKDAKLIANSIKKVS